MRRTTEKLADIPGLCGIVDGSVLPGYFGLEAGQSAVGDIFNWWVNYIQPRRQKSRLARGTRRKAAAKLKPGESGLLALDWNNGNRTILVDQRLTGLLVGQTLYTTPAEIYRALIEATAFGALTIINRFEEYGVKIDAGRQLRRHRGKEPAHDADLRGRDGPADEDVALGADVRARLGHRGAVVAGAHKDFADGAKEDDRLEAERFTSRIRRRTRFTANCIALYRTLHDAFGTQEWNGNLYGVMKQLIDIRNRVRK